MYIFVIFVFLVYILTCVEKKAYIKAKIRIDKTGF